jgi:hypothetical protein
VRESRTLGSVGAKAEWLSYPTNPLVGNIEISRKRAGTPRAEAPHAGARVALTLRRLGAEDRRSTAAPVPRGLFSPNRVG